MYLLPLHPQALLYQEIYHQIDDLRAQFRQDTGDPLFADQKCLKHIALRFYDQRKLMDYKRSFPGAMYAERNWNLATPETAPKMRPDRVEREFTRVKSLLASGLRDIHCELVSGMREMMEDIFRDDDVDPPEGSLMDHVEKRLTEALMPKDLMNCQRKDLRLRLERIQDYKATRAVVDAFCTSLGLTFDYYPTESEDEAAVIAVVRAGVVLSTYPPRGVAASRVDVELSTEVLATAGPVEVERELSMAVDVEPPATAGPVTVEREPPPFVKRARRTLQE